MVFTRYNNSKYIFGTHSVRQRIWRQCLFTKKIIHWVDFLQRNLRTRSAGSTGTCRWTLHSHSPSRTLLFLRTDRNRNHYDVLMKSFHIKTHSSHFFVAKKGVYGVFLLCYLFMSICFYFHSSNALLFCLWMTSKKTKFHYYGICIVILYFLQSPTFSLIGSFLRWIWTNCS